MVGFEAGLRVDLGKVLEFGRQGRLGIIVGCHEDSVMASQRVV